MLLNSHPIFLNPASFVLINLKSTFLSLFTKHCHNLATLLNCGNEFIVLTLHTKDEGGHLCLI